MDKVNRILERNGRTAGWLAISVCFILTGCFGPKEPPRYLDEGEHHLVRLERVEETERYDHPAEIEVETLQSVLKSIVVRHEVSFLNRLITQQSETRRAAFTPEEVILMSDRLKTALAMAAPEERVAFFLISQKNSFRTSITSGVVFVKGKEVHLIFGNDRTVMSGDHHSYVSYDNPLHSYEPGSFEVLPQTHQRKLPSNGRRKVEAIAVDYAALMTSAPGPVAPQEEKPTLSSEGSKLEADLRLLKKLREEGLITEDEYKEKKAALLKSWGID